MNHEKLREWAESIEIRTDLRETESKHQDKAKEILALIKEARENPSLDVYERLRKVQFISCIGATDYVSYCRYLQYCVNQLDSDVRKDEGATE